MQNGISMMNRARTSFGVFHFRGTAPSNDDIPIVITSMCKAQLPTRVAKLQLLKRVSQSVRALVAVGMKKDEENSR